jgi:hypothetical protein
MRLKTTQMMYQIQPRTSTWAGNVAYSKESLAADLARLRDTWRHVQSSRGRNAIFLFLTDVFELVAWWVFENQANERAERALTLKGIAVPNKIEPYRAVIVASVAPKIVDKRTVSKWSRTLRFAAACKPRKKRLSQFIKEQGGINACAAAYSRWLRRRDRNS